jgi:magnesium transporter
VGEILASADLFARRSPPPGSRPGQFVLPEDTHPTRIQALVYDASSCEERPIGSPDDLAAAVDAAGITWIDVQGLGDGSVLHWLRDVLRIHPLAIADVANTGQRPKFEDYGDRDLLVTQVIGFEATEGVTVDQLSLLVGPGFVVSVMERPLPIFDALKERLRAGGTLVCRMGVDFLAYTLLDVVIDGYFPVIEDLGDVLDDLEEEITAGPNGDTLARLHAARRTLLAVHRVMFRQRDALGAMMRTEDTPFTAGVRVYLRDAHDHAVQVLDTVETYREMAVGLTDIYLSRISHRLNEVMKTLTVIATIFIPLTFIVGIYGMNFEHMPELHWRYGYATVWAVMLATAVVLLAWFRQRGWIGHRRRDGPRDR